MTDRNGVRWYTIREIAVAVDRSVKTVRRALRPYRDECRLTRTNRHPRRLLVMPELVAKALREIFAR
jgi:transposase